MIDTEHCRGCRDDFYNHTNMGMNMDGGRPRCWNVKDATMVRAKDVPVHMPPPYTSLPLVNRPSCYKASGYVRVKPESLTVTGFWRV